MARLIPALDEDDLPDLDDLFRTHASTHPDAQHRFDDSSCSAQESKARAKPTKPHMLAGQRAVAGRSKTQEQSTDRTRETARTKTESSAAAVQQTVAPRRKRVVLNPRSANPLLLPLRHAMEAGDDVERVVVRKEVGIREAANRTMLDRRGRLRRDVVVVEEEEVSSLGRESGRADDSSSDGMSDFVVDDDAESCTSGSEEEEVERVPRSTRRLVRGLRPGSAADLEVFGRLDAAQNTADDSLDASGAFTIDSVTVKDKETIEGDKAVTKRPSRPSPCKKLLFSRASLLDDLEDPFANLSLGPSLDRPKSSIRGVQHTTPPTSPQKPGTGLASPSKKLRIPQTPHRPSMDSFWKQDVVNEWNDEYSPHKTLKTSRLPEQPAEDSSGEIIPRTSPKKSPQRKDKAAIEAKRLFTERKNDIAMTFLEQLDKTLTQGQIAVLTASTGGVKIIWSKTLNTTAGRASWKREATKARVPSQGVVTSITYKHHASIELAEKVIDGEDRLLNTLAHEFCHLTTFMISNMRTNPHGKEFKSWASKCSTLFGHRGVEVTTKHSYAIEFKYVWECATCLLQYKRHSKSIDPARHRCSTCKSALVQIKPVPKANGTAVNQYQLFVKENMGKVREENPGSPQKVIMTLIGKKYQEQKAEKLAPAVVVEEVSSEDECSGTSKGIRRKIDFLNLVTP